MTYENLEKEINEIKEYLQVLPRKTKNNKIDYNKYIENQIERLKPEFDKINKEVIRRYNALYKSYKDDNLP